MMTSELVNYEIRQQTAILTLNRPEKLNALSHALIASLHEAVDRAAADSSARCVILTGAGSTFCAGMDLAELQQSITARPQESEVWENALRLNTLFDRLYRLPKPTVAAVNGAAVAGGAGLVTICDLALAVPEARLGYPEVRRGLVAALVMPHLLRHVGERMARYLLLTGELIGAAEARDAGLINSVVAPEKLIEHALKWTRSLAEGGPHALKRTKELLHLFSRQALSIEEVARESAAPRLTDECRQGLHAFFAKQPVPWAPR
jgi:methylglutaconyl-CoA hydratase